METKSSDQILIQFVNPLNGNLLLGNVYHMDFISSMVYLLEAFGIFISEVRLEEGLQATKTKF